MSEFLYTPNERYLIYTLSDSAKIIRGQYNNEVLSHILTFHVRHGDNSVDMWIKDSPISSSKTNKVIFRAKYMRHISNAALKRIMLRK